MGCLWYSPIIKVKSSVEAGDKVDRAIGPNISKLGQLFLSYLVITLRIGGGNFGLFPPFLTLVGVDRDRANGELA